MYNRCAQRHFKLSELAVQNGGLCSVTTGIGKRLPQIPQLRGSKGASSPTRFCSTTIQTIGVAVQNGQMWCPKCLTVVLNGTLNSRNWLSRMEGCAPSQPGSENGCHRGQPSKGCLPRLRDGRLSGLFCWRRDVQNGEARSCGSGKFCPACGSRDCGKEKLGIGKCRADVQNVQNAEDRECGSGKREKWKVGNREMQSGCPECPKWESPRVREWKVGSQEGKNILHRGVQNV